MKKTEEPETKKVVKKEKVAPKKVAKKVKDFSAIYDANKTYAVAEALEIVKKITSTKFDASVEVHFRLGINPKKGDQQVRGAVSLPNGTGKTVRIAAFVAPENEKAAKEAGADFVGSTELIEEIKKTGKTDFEVAVAEPALMRQLAVIAKVLGTRGLMPSPKNDTVTADVPAAVAQLKKGKISYKNDDTANLHCLIGKVSFDTAKLVENYNALVDSLKKAKPSTAKGSYIKAISVCSSMSRGVKVIIS